MNLWKNFEDERAIFIQIWNPATCELEKNATQIVLQAMPEDAEKEIEDENNSFWNNQEHFKQTHHSVVDLAYVTEVYTCTCTCTCTVLCTLYPRF